MDNVINRVCTNGTVLPTGFSSRDSTVIRKNGTIDKFKSVSTVIHDRGAYVTSFSARYGGKNTLQQAIDMISKKRDAYYAIFPNLIPRPYAKRAS